MKLDTLDRIPSWSWMLVGFVGFFVAFLVTNLLACDPNGLRAQASTANVLARGINTVARPALLQAYESGGEQALRRACPSPPCDRGMLERTLQEHDRGWAVVFASYQAAKVAHDVWRREIERCRQRPSEEQRICAPMVGRLAQDVLGLLTVFRCAVRTVGREDLDPMPGPISCADVALPTVRADSGVD